MEEKYLECTRELMLTIRGSRLGVRSKMKDISVIMPIYNVEKYIENCIKSIINQDFENFEIVLVDDGSQDDSVKIVEAILDNTTLDYKVYKKPNGGVSSARNYGYKKANSDYVIFIDSDDVICENYLSILYNAAIETNADISICNYNFVKNQSIGTEKIPNTSVYSSDEFSNRFLKRNIDFILPTMLIRKEVLDSNKILFNENTSFSEDQQYMWECILASEIIAYTNVKGYGYYLRPCSTMTASGYDKIMNGYYSFVDFSSNVLIKYGVDVSFSKRVLSRWVVGTVFTCSKTLSFDGYKSMLSIIWNNHIIIDMIRIGEMKAIALSLMISLSKRVSYFICKEIL